MHKPKTTVCAEIWNMGAAERQLKVMEMRCLRSICRVRHVDPVMDEKVRGRTGVARKLADRGEQRMLR